MQRRSLGRYYNNRLQSVAKKTNHNEDADIKLAYDFVKASGGEKKLETKKVEGRELKCNYHSRACRGVASIGIVTTDFSPLQEH